MKKLSIIVPSYNSEAFLERCIDSLLIDDNSIEIIIVNDGSTDNTQAIAEQYRARYPTIVKVHQQANAGHGGAINAGLELVSGRYVKIVDSDDWLDQIALKALLKQIEHFSKTEAVDMIIANYVYEKEGRKSKKVMRYTKSLPLNQYFGWGEFKLPMGKYLLMHSIVYRTQMLKELNLELPKHSFYVDNIYAFVPLQAVKTMYYMDVDLYRYHIGRQEQSVNEKNMIRQIDQQLFVNKVLIDEYKRIETEEINLRKYLFHYLEIITGVSSVMMIRSNTEENLEKKTWLWNYIKESNTPLYKDLKRGLIGAVLSPDLWLNRKLTIGVYKAIQIVYGLN